MPAPYAMLPGRGRAARRRSGDRPSRRAFRICTVLCALAALVTGCGGDRSQPVSAASTVASVPPAEPRTRLAGLAAAAHDRRYLAVYTLTSPNRTARSVAVTMAVDGSWRVDVPGGALGGTADVVIASTKDGLYQCASPPLATGPTPGRTAGPLGCARLADAKSKIPARYDPRVQHPFTDWIAPLIDRDTALSVAAAPNLDNVTGACFSVESLSASVAPPLDTGVYCFQPDGLLTGARLGFGTLALSAPAGPPPPTVGLPGPVVPGPGLTTAPPPTPSPSPSARPSPTPTKPR